MAETIPADQKFYERSDAFIHLANAQLQTADGANVSASMAYASARFNGWLCANMYGTPANMKQMKDEAINGLTEHYRRMLNDSFDQIIQHFESFNPGVASR
ncbi:MAG: DUF3144 domain-containing protein [Asticcacaulis sp.]